MLICAMWTFITAYVATLLATLWYTPRSASTLSTQHIVHLSTWHTFVHVMYVFVLVEGVTHHCPHEMEHLSMWHIFVHMTCSCQHDQPVILIIAGFVGLHGNPNRSVAFIWPSPFTVRGISHLEALLLQPMSISNPMVKHINNGGRLWKISIKLHLQGPVCYI